MSIALYALFALLVLAAAGLVGLLLVQLASIATLPPDRSERPLFPRNPTVRGRSFEEVPALPRPVGARAPGALVRPTDRAGEVAEADLRAHVAP